MQRYDLQQIALGIAEHSNIRPTSIVEIGSRDGLDAHELANYFRLNDLECHVFEANPAQAKKIKFDYPLMHVYPNAVSDIKGPVTFNVELENLGASSLFSRVTPKEHMQVITVDAIRMDDWIKEENIHCIDVCKIDVEGASLKVLNSFGDSINIVNSIQIECEHQPVWKDGDQFPQVKEWLEAHGFVMVFYVLLRGIQSDSFWLRKERMIV